jgi:hypothetical protein
MIVVQVPTTCPHCGGDVAIIQGVQECLDCFWSEEDLIQGVQVDERKFDFPFVTE